jgi:8-oxo-dGTP diphosphatase
MMEEKHVVTSFLEYDNKILILRRSQAVGTYQGKWAGVSGYIEEGNIPFKQSLEEIREETGLSRLDVKLIKKGEVLEVVDEDLGRKWVVHPYLFRVKDPTKVRIDWEHKEAKWILPQDIDKYSTVPKLKETWQRVENEN